MELHSDLWLDQRDAHERVGRMRAQGLVSAAEAAALDEFADHGCVALTLDLAPDFCAEFDTDVARLWRERPADLAVSPPGPVGPTAFSEYDGAVRTPGYRIPDLHSHSDRALDLYLDKALFRMIELIYGEPALAFQSLYFEYGSQQGLHRDPMFVVTDPPSHLLASWVALEDCGPDSGPLAYVPRSHRLDWYEFTPGSVVCGHKTTSERRQEFLRWTQDQIQDHALETKQFACRRGDAFIWHAGLLHGGMPIRDANQTRKSFVTHYCTAARYSSRTAGMRVRDAEGGWRRETRTTDRVLERDRAHGLDNPLRGVRTG